MHKQIGSRLLKDHANFVSIRCSIEIQHIQVQKGTSIPIKGHGGPLSCETSRLPHFLDNRLTVGGEVVSLTRRQPFTSRKIPGTHFCQRAESTPRALVRLEGLGQLKNPITSSGIRTGDLQACSYRVPSQHIQRW
jgi:hypothetical protein